MYIHIYTHIDIHPVIRDRQIHIHKVCMYVYIYVIIHVYILLVCYIPSQLLIIVDDIYHLNSHND